MSTAARQMIGVALDERRAYLEAHADERDAAGKRMVVGNGYARWREATTAARRVAVAAPRVDDRREGEKFTSALLRPYMRPSPKVTECIRSCTCVDGHELVAFVRAGATLFGRQGPRRSTALPAGSVKNRR